MKNFEIAKVLYIISAFEDLKGESFKSRAYQRAAHTIESFDRDVFEIYKQGGTDALMEIPGVGEGIAKKIVELLETGKLKYFEEIKKKLPVDLENLTKIEGVGIKTVKKLYEKLKIKNVEDLEKAAKSGKIRKLEGFGEKSEQDILKGIEFYKKSKGRFLIGYALPILKDVEEKLKNFKYVEKVLIGGSTRRMKETIGDADFLVVSEDPRKVIDFFASMPEIGHVYGKGEHKVLARLKIGLDADLLVIPKKSFGAAMQYFTGNKEHNVTLRKIAISKGWKLNEYGIFKGNKTIAGETEEGVYEILGLRWMPPELRENTGEIEASIKNKLPNLIEYGSLKGDLQQQTKWSDGSNSIEEMAEESRKLGLEYIAISDHTKSLAMAGGLDEKKLMKQKAEIEKLNKKISGIKILSGAEVNIMKDGSLDIDDATLKKLDIVGAAVHSNFNISREEQTKRIIRAIENPNVDILFHPTGRIIQQRDPYEVDLEKIFQAAHDTGTILEIDSLPERLDLKDEHTKKAKEFGCKFSIDSDAHVKSQIRFLELGIAQARRGWCETKDVVNTLPLEKFLKSLK